MKYIGLICLSKSFHNLDAILSLFVFTKLLNDNNSSNYYGNKLHVREGFVPVNVRQSRRRPAGETTFGHVSAHGSLVTFTHV